MELTRWAAGVSGDLLRDVGTRWPHVQRAAQQARSVAHTVLPEDRELLVAAALLHDIGYAPAIAHTGFHPLDGARWLRDQGVDERLVCLVAHHTGALIEAERRGLRAELEVFPFVASEIADALWYADLTSSPTGDAVDVDTRLDEILVRYSPGSVVFDSITQARPILEAAVHRVEGQLACPKGTGPELNRDEGSRRSGSR
ncbi:metal-dependent phosphohydrolase, HD subdomain protein [Nocardiopsis kunsanensis]|uniref:Metal-dependent phosphohydrolase, HD subdomain protein n=1 Tax=Nocardiopsis kunsanensis TaxID=141693 RepID=A0A918XAX4_9ACTN|nr:HD domain-containing protein [Nocardiopsis kunsanensis]GHD23195.1 metal-dependent phosphohydrolase, HD subdomain protein [Nocardiopsis kunsanensis]